MGGTITNAFLRHARWAFCIAAWHLSGLRTAPQALQLGLLCARCGLMASWQCLEPCEQRCVVDVQSSLLTRLEVTCSEAVQHSQRIQAHVDFVADGLTSGQSVSIGRWVSQAQCYRLCKVACVVQCSPATACTCQCTRRSCRVDVLARAAITCTVNTCITIPLHEIMLLLSLATVGVFLCVHGVHVHTASCLTLPRPWRLLCCVELQRTNRCLGTALRAQTDAQKHA